MFTSDLPVPIPSISLSQLAVHLVLTQSSGSYSDLRFKLRDNRSLGWTAATRRVELGWGRRVSS
ncbi:hypothetical protein PILCRDRAFT_820865 [Piloderma croceum F 1598]|uniref:Uncharacterized protein n=1 Tax=Piloderma croceum (strain F 1598) TaxID=765440 RepID=A0A0C3FBA9_PILCF|nr:hypothetical protein PILCRDRAFT_830198 [Piloderma croceum F 1598]KIM81980.1 hypothetical protein PILCRDRAFT_820865 [Piloderma croceum F 1598]